MTAKGVRTYRCSKCHGKTTTYGKTGYIQTFDRTGRLMTYELCEECYMKVEGFLVNLNDLEESK